MNDLVATLLNNEAHGDDAIAQRKLGPDRGLYAVMDGVSAGGLGNIASVYVRQKMLSEPIASLDDIYRILLDADVQLHQQHTGNAATTVACALRIGNMLYTANVGDSPIYLVRGEQPDTLECITTSDGSPNDGYISQAIGLGRLTQENIHTAQFPLKNNDMLLLVTDGVDDNFERSELAAVLNKSAHAHEIISALVDSIAAKKSENSGRKFGGWKDDDYSAIVRCFTNIQPTPPTPPTPPEIQVAQQEPQKYTPPLVDGFRTKTVTPTDVTNTRESAGRRINPYFGAAGIVLAGVIGGVIGFGANEAWDYWSARTLSQEAHGAPSSKNSASQFYPNDMFSGFREFSEGYGVIEFKIPTRGEVTKLRMDPDEKYHTFTAPNGDIVMFGKFPYTIASKASKQSSEQNLASDKRFGYVRLQKIEKME